MIDWHRSVAPIPSPAAPFTGYSLSAAIPYTYLISENVIMPYPGVLVKHPCQMPLAPRTSGLKLRPAKLMPSVFQTSDLSFVVFTLTRTKRRAIIVVSLLSQSVSKESVPMSPMIKQPLTIEYALLGFLRQQPMHAYEIHQTLMRSVRFLLAARSASPQFNCPL